MATTPASHNAATEGLDEPKEEKTKNQEGLVLSKMKTKKENENEKKTKEKKIRNSPFKRYRYQNLMIDPSRRLVSYFFLFLFLFY